MAIATNPRDFSAPRGFPAKGVHFGPKTRAAIFYIFVGVTAMAIAIPAALMSADAGMFEECFAAVEICAAP